MTPVESIVCRTSFIGELHMYMEFMWIYGDLRILHGSTWAFVPEVSDYPVPESECFGFICLRVQYVVPPLTFIGGEAYLRDLRAFTWIYMDIARSQECFVFFVFHSDYPVLVVVNLSLSLRVHSMSHTLHCTISAFSCH